MNEIIDFFNFDFLKKMDRYLLLNHSKIWIFKLPYIAFYGFVMNLLLVVILLFVDESIYTIPEFMGTLLGFWSILIFLVYRQMNGLKIGKEYSRDSLSGRQEFLILLFTIFILGTSLSVIQSVIILKQYPYETKQHEPLLMYVDDDNYSKTLAISTIEELEKSKYKSEYNQIILDLVDIKEEEITNEVIATAKENYTFYHDLNSYEWIEEGLVMLLFITLMIFYYRLSSLKTIGFLFLAILPLGILDANTIDIYRLISLFLYQSLVVYALYLLYLAGINRPLFFSLMVFAIVANVLFISDVFTKDLKLPFTLIPILILFIFIVFFASSFKRKLLELEAEPKEL